MNFVLYGSDITRVCVVVCLLQFQQQIHCVIPQANGSEPLIMFTNGAVYPLSTAVESRKEENISSLLSTNEVIEDYHLLANETCTFITIISRSSLVYSTSTFNTLDRQVF
jgi:hypothetical protein